MMRATRDTNDMVLLLKASSFAADKHKTQRRKDPGETPYINHPLEVAALLAENGVNDRSVLLAALLHDTLEDTETVPEEIEAVFGLEVRRIVEEVSDDRSLDRRERKRLQIERAPFGSNAAKLVKLADKICNLRDISRSPPKGWSRARCEGYYRWAREVVAGLRGTNQGLEDLFDRIYNEFLAEETVGEGGERPCS